MLNSSITSRVSTENIARGKERFLASFFFVNVECIAVFMQNPNYANNVWAAARLLRFKRNEKRKSPSWNDDGR